MSNYKQITRHPDGHYEMAEYWDDYFGAHEYAVKFESDSRYWPIEKINSVALREFWTQDVLDAMDILGWSTELKVDLLAEVNKAYKARWSRDPEGGEGAVDYFRKTKTAGVYL